MDRAKEPLLIIAGPTASGKSDAAVALAQRMQGSVISADSMQVYRGMDIGSAKITATPSFHDDQRGAKRGKNLLFAVEADGVKVVHLGDLGHLPDAAQLKAISGADVMLIPVGGTYTITSEQAVEVVGMARPRLAVAMHFANQYCHFPVTGPEAFLQALDGKNLPNEIDLSDLAGLPRAAVMAEPE